MSDLFETSAKRIKTDDVNEESDASWDSEASIDASDEDVVSESENLPTIWEVVRDSAEKDFDGNVLDAYVSLVKSWHYFKQDADHRKIMTTLQRYRDGPDEMDFQKALLKAANKRVHLIERKVEEVKNSETEEEQ